LTDSMPKINSEIAAYYGSTPDTGRLEQGAFLLEGVRTRELIERFAPPPPVSVFDVGGAAGAYSFWLAENGYTAHLLDPVPKHIDDAVKRNANALHPLASHLVGDARRLPFSDSSADIVLLLGPLYHLTDSADRASALTEAARVLKFGGILFAAAISRWASTLDGLARDLFADPRFAAIADQDLNDGQHRNPTERADYFTTAYFHRPEDLKAEVAAAGFSNITVFGIEGPGWLLPDIAERLADPVRRENLLRAARMVEAEPEMVGSSAHLLAVARKA
jgi:ubiquinone/menaquinone biosynthesis C-methylase UbiE